MLNFKLGAAALALEISSWTLAGFLTERSDAALLGYLMLHAGASGVLALCMLPLLMGERTKPRWAVLALIASFSFVVPVVGFFSVVLAVLTVRVYPSREPGQDFASVELPEFDQHQRMQGNGRSAGMRAFLNNRAAPTQSRLRALVALNHVTGRVASPLLRDVLNDHSDELRLLAYGMLDRMEQKLSRAIHEEFQVLQASEAEARQAGTPLSSRGLMAAYRLADLYWEMVYQELASDDLRDFAVQESLRYCDMVLARIGNHAPLTLRRGRLLHALGRLDEAAQCYDKAQALGLPETRVRPYQAQISFERGDFAQVQALMRSMGPQNALPKLRPVIDYWS